MRLREGSGRHQEKHDEGKCNWLEDHRGEDPVGEEDRSAGEVGGDREATGCTTRLATRPSIDTPLARVSNEATSTALKRRPSTSCISRSRTGDSI